MDARGGNSSVPLPLRDASISGVLKDFGQEACLVQNSRGLWLGDNPLDFRFPVMLLQIVLIFSLSRTIYWLLRPFKQPRFVCNLMAGIILGPSGLGRNKKFSDHLFDSRALHVLNVMSVFGAIYFVFLIAVKMDASMITRATRSTWNIAIAGTLFPLLAVFSLLYFLKHKLTAIHQGYFLLSLACGLSFSFFAVIAHALDELNLLTSELGQLALSLATISDASQLLLVAVFVVVSQEKTMSSIAALVSILAFVAFTVFVIRPAILMIIKRTPAGKPVKEIYIVAIFTGVAVMAVILNIIGAAMIHGAIVLGLVIPDGPPLGSTLTEKAETLVSEVFLPFIFVFAGYETNVYSLKNWKAFFLLQFIIVAAYCMKLIGIVTSALYSKIKLKNAVLLSLIMNIRGLFDLLAYTKWLHNNVRFDSFSFLCTDFQFLPHQAFLFCCSSLTINLLLGAVDDGLNDDRNADGRNPLQASNATESAPVDETEGEEINPRTRKQLGISDPFVCSQPRKCSQHHHPPRRIQPDSSKPSLRLRDPLRRARRPSRTPSRSTQKHRRKSKDANSANSEHIMRAFENYSNNSGGPVAVHPFVLNAPYKSMHDCISRFAQENLIHFIIIPFHENQSFLFGQQTVGLIRHFNTSLQASAPCAVGILVDRNLRCHLSSANFSYNIAVIFIGGVDDREALALAARMSGHSEVRITVLHIILRSNGKNLKDMETKFDETLVDEFKLKNVRNPRVVVNEIVVEDGVKVIDSLVTMEKNYDLVMVGRRRGNALNIDEEMSDFIENAELGAIGDTLSSSDICEGEVPLLVMHRGDDIVGEYLFNPTDYSRSSLKASEFQRFNGG